MHTGAPSALCVERKRKHHLTLRDGVQCFTSPQTNSLGSIESVLTRPFLTKGYLSDRVLNVHTAPICKVIDTATKKNMQI